MDNAISKATLHRYDITGSHHRPPAKAVLNVLPTGAKLQLRHEPVPPSIGFDGDPNAIAVYTTPNEINNFAQQALVPLAADCGWELSAIMNLPEIHLGYIPAKAAATIRLSESTLGLLTFSLEGKPQVEFDQDWRDE